jgi:hypothetical protein
MEDNDPTRVNLPCALCTPRSDAKTKGSIRHIEYNHALVLWGVLCYATKVRFEHMVPVQKWHLPIRLDPHLKSSSICQFPYTDSGLPPLHTPFYLRFRGTDVCTHLVLCVLGQQVQTRNM